jgi:hypothetical protein
MGFSKGDRTKFLRLWAVVFCYVPILLFWLVKIKQHPEFSEVILLTGIPENPQF